MTEFISRKYGNEGYEIIIKTDSHEHYRAAEDFARKLIDHAKPVTDNNVGSRWIPVTERLPDLELEEVKTDDNDLFPCLAARKHQRAKNGKYTAKVWYDGYGFIDGISNDVTDEVTHWMPLPEPPGKE